MTLIQRGSEPFPDRVLASLTVMPEDDAEPRTPYLMDIPIQPSLPVGIVGDTSASPRVAIYTPPVGSPAITNDLIEEVVPWQGTLRVAFSRSRVSFRDREGVEAHPEYSKVWSILEAAWPSLLRCFGGAVDIVLEVIAYPEEGAYDELVAWIRSNDSVQKALDKLERFEDEWFLDHLDEIGNRFNFNIEIV